MRNPGRTKQSQYRLLFKNQNKQTENARAIYGEIPKIASTGEYKVVIVSDVGGDKIDDDFKFKV